MGDKSREPDSPSSAAGQGQPATARKTGNARKGNTVIKFTEMVDPPFDRQGMIATAAYFLAQRRGFVPGHEAEDWLAAERHVDVQLALAKLGPASGSS